MASNCDVALAWRGLEALPDGQRQLLSVLVAEAEQQGWVLYLVGGAVRDLLLRPAVPGLGLPDLDLVVEGAAPGAGIQLGERLGRLYPDVHLHSYGTFQTCALTWPADSGLGPLSMDIATARAESYPHPGANPVVRPATLAQDLGRRDFTINAMAVRLTEPRAGTWLDPFGGQQDLERRQLRVLHEHSFADDPSRLYRGARLAARLGLTLEPHTEALWRQTLARNPWQPYLQHRGGAPALQHRLRGEFKYLFQSESWRPALRLLAVWRGLDCLVPDFPWQEAMVTQIATAGRLAQAHPFATETWLLSLAVLLTALPPAQRRGVVTQLDLPPKVGQCLESCDALQRCLQSAGRPSQVVAQLEPLGSETLVLLAATGPPWLRRLIRRYWSTWSQIRPFLTGDDLQALGYRPGPTFRGLLQHLRAATLDGVLRDRPAALAYLQSLDTQHSHQTVSE
ncbi:MAG: CCA tRNA nucleotidyltransferase [Gloeomargaritaceae cyanobacterium C42_A2020_066]|nr:CCA tRNA nucleotidyltransferase [Gloeomargaritaceae cyanobacterium C42_A2020_066]